MERQGETMKEKGSIHSKRKRFCKDFSLPIKVLKDEYFQYYIDLFDDLYSTKEKCKLFTDYLNYLEENSLDFFNVTNDVVTRVQADILSMPEFEYFSKEMNLDDYKTKNSDIVRRKTYQIDHAGEEFVSIDIVTANYQAMKFINNKLVSDTNNFDELIRKYTDIEYIIKSKKIRQIIFGDKKLNPKRQQRVQKYIMSELYTYLVESGTVSEDIELELTSDEIVFNKKYLKKDIEEALSNLPESINSIEFRLERFSLELIHEGRDFFKRIDADTGEYKIKNTPDRFIPEIIKYLKDKENYPNNLVKEDRLFYDDGRLCSFEDTLF